ncbi:hypothetical protein TrST_g5810 [Triparma strigata]|uniref:RING-type domain-containing protein n=1 Tax=Triparma strigata TaxID=1606541 RepID=A0A9W7BV78_9STRA|nr:hypothetical protein TrST_g5810 [Triparma strigata]
MPKRSANDDIVNDSNDGDGRSKRTKTDEEKEDGAETGSEPPHLGPHLSSSSEAKNVDYVENVNAFLVGLLHKEDERETKEENGEAAVCAICKESEPNAKILPCGHSASCSLCTQTVIDCGNGSEKCPFCAEGVSEFQSGEVEQHDGGAGTLAKRREKGSAGISMICS